MITKRLNDLSFIVGKKLRCHDANILDYDTRFQLHPCLLFRFWSVSRWAGSTSWYLIHTHYLVIFETMYVVCCCHIRFKFLSAVFVLLVLIFSCKNKQNKRTPERSFYYWKSVLKSNDEEILQLDSLHVKTIYLKLFDVDRNDRTHENVPLAKLQVQQTNMLTRFKIIPVVFITSECIRQTDSAQASDLAVKIYTLINSICSENKITFNEIQLDCDWTAATARPYFSLIKKMKDLSRIIVSVTIRLHQVKYISKSGVPPADKGMLMCYNMGNLKNTTIKNSIIDVNELKKYIGSLYAYPLPMDVALPVFDWMVLFRNQQYKGLINDLSVDALSSSFAISKGNRIDIIKDTLLNGYDFRKGDFIRIESSDMQQIKEAAREISSRLKNTKPAIALYHFDYLTLKKYTTNDLESVYNIFN